MYTINSPIGKLHAVITQEGISYLGFSEHITSMVNDKTDAIFHQLKLQLEEYFSGVRTKFELPLNPQGTDFQKNVWDELLKIPYGKTISYKEQSTRLNNLKAIRAIASANVKNPLMILIPCHRVIGSSGALTGYAGGIRAKEWLLNLESGQQTLF